MRLGSVANRPLTPGSKVHLIEAVILSDRSEAKGVEGSAFLVACEPRTLKKYVSNLRITTPRAPK